MQANELKEERGKRKFPKGIRAMAIKITKPPGTACGTYLPHSSEIGPNKQYKNPPYYYQSDYEENQREQLIPAGTCFQVTRKEEAPFKMDVSFQVCSEDTLTLQLLLL